MAAIGSPIILMLAMKDRQITNADTAMGNAEVASVIIRTSILHADAAWLAEQSDVGVFGLTFFLSGLFSAYEAMVHHDKIIKAAGKLKASRDRQTERVKELELRLATLKGKVAEAEKKLQTMDSVLKSSSQEITILKEEKEQLSATLTASKESLADAVKAAKEEGCNEATAIYEVQFAKLGNMLFEDGWTSALQVSNVPMESELKKNTPYPRPDAVENQVDRLLKGLELKTLLQ